MPRTREALTEEGIVEPPPVREADIDFFELLDVLDQLGLRVQKEEAQAYKDIDEDMMNRMLTDTVVFGERRRMKKYIEREITRLLQGGKE